MGKAAKNEIIKLKAAYLNNIAVGLFVAGFFFPYFAYYSKLAEHGWVWWGSLESVIADTKATLPAILACSLSLIFRDFAKRTLEKIED
jgi:hypothetical protein